MFLEYIDKSVEENWKPVSAGGVVALSLLVAWIAWQHFFTTGQWVFLLDNANLTLHEAGHPIVGLFSKRLYVYGGTIFQVLFPLLFACYFRRRRQSLGWAASLVWLGENLMNIGRYMKDARAQQLPLVGGGDHDWTEIFSRWAILTSNVRIGNSLKALGLGIALYAIWWAWRQYCSQRPSS